MRISLHSRDTASPWNLSLPSTPSMILSCDPAGRATLANANGPLRHWPDPLSALAWMASSIRTSPNPARWIGYLSYDLGRYFESLPARARDDLHLPLFVFTFHNSERMNPLPRYPGGGLGRGPSAPHALASNLPRPHYIAAVNRILDYIRAGDVFQVNIAQRFSTPLLSTPEEIFSRLPPAEFGALLDFGHFSLLSNSPELFLRVSPDGQVLTRPIKGTRPAAEGMHAALQRSPKDQAELNMIVDLERNDLGRVCRIGSIRVTQPRVIEHHATVFHGVASIQGLLRPDVSFVDLLRATFPGGSVTGAPKIRAMQIIDELEPHRRGPYCGAIGYLDSLGNIQFNLAIRTIILTRQSAHVYVGGGIVADSDPDQEYQETLLKAQAMFTALGLRYNPDT